MYASAAARPSLARSFANEQRSVQPHVGLETRPQAGPAPSSSKTEDLWREPSNWGALEPIAKPLGSKVLSTELETQLASDLPGFNSIGLPRQNGINLQQTSHSLRLSFGLGRGFALFVHAPYFAAQKRSLRSQDFRRSAIYRGNYSALRSSLAAQIGTDNPELCSDQQDCEVLIDSPERNRLTSPTTLELSRDESLVIPAQQPLSEALDQAVFDIARLEDGAAGLGDIETGLSFASLREGRVRLAHGLMLRAPTGSFENVSSRQLATGRGRWTLGLQTYLDVLLARAFIISAFHQTDWDASYGKRKASFLLTSGQDQNSSQTYQRIGLEQHGFLRLRIGLGTFDPALRPFGVQLGLRYRVTTSEQILETEDVVTPDRATQHVVFGFHTDLRRYRLPVQFELRLEEGLAGVNLSSSERRFVLNTRLLHAF